MRCSSLPILSACSGAALPCKHPHNPPSPVAALGTAAHEIAACIATGRHYDVPTVAAAHNVELDALGLLAHQTRCAWNDVRHLFPSPRAEVRVDCKLVGGTADLIDDDMQSITVLDWKTGRVYRDPRAQIMGYLLAARATIGRRERYTGLAAFVALKQIDRFDCTNADLDAFEAHIKSQVERAGEQFAAGEICTYCPRQNECAARAEYISAAGSALIAASNDGAALTANDLAALHPRAAMLDAALKEYRKALRLAVEKSGELELPNGKKLVITTANRTTIDPLRAYAVFENAGLSPEQIAGELTLTKTAAMKLALLLDDGSKPAAKKRSMMEALDDAGAVENKQYSKIMTVKSDWVQS